MIQARILGVEGVVTNLSQIAQRANEVIRRALMREAINLAAYVKEFKLTDQVLHVRTGRLRRSITTRFEDIGSTGLRAFVGTNVKYAAIHEFGFSGSVTVKAHTVKSFTRMQSMAFGKPIEPRQVNVRAHVVREHAAKMNMPARPFLFPSLEENKERITANLRKAIAEALQ